MTNDFSTLSAESAESHLAQVTTEELVPHKRIHRRNWSIFQQVHKEIQSKLDKQQTQDEILASV